MRGSIWGDKSTKRGQPGPSAEVRRLASKIDRIRERSEGAEADRKAAVNRDKGGEGRNRDRDEAEIQPWGRQRNEVTGSSPSFRDSGGPRTILIGGWRILGYGGTIGYDCSCPI